METKICTRCKVDKPIEDFYKRKDGHDIWCKSCHKSYAAEKYPERKARMVIKNKEYRERTKDKWVEYFNRPDIKLKKRLYKREYDRKMMQDPIHRLSNNIRGNMHHALKAKKAGRTWESLVGYTVEDLIKHLESKFVGNISWENYGSVWHVDHVVPKSWFKYESTDDPKFKECWALSNLQPKLKEENISKRDRFAG